MSRLLNDRRPLGAGSVLVGAEEVRRVAGVRHRLDSGAIYVRAYDLQGNTIEAEWTINLSSVDDDEIDVRPSIGRGGEQRIGLFHLVGGTTILKTSPDGKTFN